MMSKDIAELKQQCMKIAQNFRWKADELQIQADDLIDSARYIQSNIDTGHVLGMQNIVKMHSEVTEDEEDGRQ